MERKGEMTKALLGQKFKELVVKKSFDKITIKMITDEAGCANAPKLCPSLIGTAS